VSIATNGKPTKEDPRMPAGRPLVRAGQRFIGALAGRRAWNVFFAFAGMSALGVAAIGGEIILNLQNQLAQRQPYIVGLTTAHKLVPLFPDGTAAVTCDDLCIDGQLEDWVTSFRTITGEVDAAQTEQHRLQARAVSMIGAGSDAERYAKNYYAAVNPYTDSAKGMKLEVKFAHVSAVVGMTGKFEAHWTDVVSNIRNGQEMGRHNYSAYIDATSVPGARSEQNVHDNPGGVVITHVEQFGVTQ
jgi:hypothetical protein